MKLKGMFYTISSPSLSWKWSRSFDTLGWCCCLGRAIPHSAVGCWIHLQSGAPTKIWGSASAGCLHRNMFPPHSFISSSLCSVKHPVPPSQDMAFCCFVVFQVFLPPAAMGWMNTGATLSQRVRSDHLVLLSTSNYSHCLEVGHSSTDQ